MRKEGALIRLSRTWPSAACFCRSVRTASAYLAAKSSCSSVVAKTTNIGQLFWQNNVYNQALNHWDVANVENMAFTFSNTASFDQPLHDWNVGKVTTMTLMFGILGTNALSDCNKRIIHDSFEAQVPSVWGYSWGGYSYCPPSPPPQD